MKIITQTTRVAAILALALILVSCNTPTAVVAPTQDIPTIRTESAATVVAKITIEAALNPTATTAPTEPAPTAAAAETTAPTATTAPAAAATSTPVPTFTPAATLKPTTVTSGSGGTGTGGTGVIYPTATRRAGPDQAQLIDQAPKDGTILHPSEEFDGAFTFKNIGTSTWGKEFFIRPAKNKGTNMAKKELFPLTGDVAPGQTVKAFADLVAPSTAGRYVTYWELCNSNDEIFYTFYLVVDVK